MKKNIHQELSPKRLKELQAIDDTLVTFKDEAERSAVLRMLPDILLYRSPWFCRTNNDLKEDKFLFQLHPRMV